jgi:flavin reductase (DIM6/NTAB) family NADH-FMN oxidoreductase RutF
VALYKLSYGLHVLTARESEKDNGCIANTCFQVAEAPDKLAISVQVGNLTRQMIERTGQFNVSVLTEDVPFETVRHFGMQSGQDTEKFDGTYQTKRSHNGLVYLTENTNAMFSCKVLERIELGSHVMFIGEVTESKVLGDDPSCTYAHYHKAIKPKF